MSSVLLSSAQSKDVCPSVFVPEKEYTCKGICLWGIFKAHVHAVNDGTRSLLGRAVHFVLAVLEFLPVLGQLVSAIECVIFKIFAQSFGKNPKGVKLEAGEPNPQILDLKTLEQEKQDFDAGLQFICLEYAKIRKLEDEEENLNFNFKQCLDHFNRMQTFFNKITATECPLPEGIDSGVMGKDLEDTYNKLMEVGAYVVPDCLSSCTEFPRMPSELPSLKGKIIERKGMHFIRPDHNALLSLAKEVEKKFKNDCDVWLVPELFEEKKFASVIYARRKHSCKKDLAQSVQEDFEARILEIAKTAGCKSVEILEADVDPNDVCIRFYYTPST